MYFMNIKRLTGVACFLTSFSVFAQSSKIIGHWKTIDDSTGETESIVEIFRKSDGKYYGKVVQMLVKPENENCIKCKDDRKNKPLVGLEVIRGLSEDRNEFTGGTITDPKNGKSYKCIVTRGEDDKLNVRGYIGFSLIGRTQVWYLVK